MRGIHAGVVRRGAANKEGVEVDGEGLGYTRAVDHVNLGVSLEATLLVVNGEVANIVVLAANLAFLDLDSELEAIRDAFETGNGIKQ